MKKNLLYMSLVLTFIWAGCDEDTTDNVSIVTTYPVFEFEGNTYMVVPQGEPYSEPGVTARIGDEEIETEVNGAPDTSTPGIYIITYSAVNEDGYSRSVTRTVGVSLEDPAAPNVISGFYLRGTVPSLIIKTEEPNAYYSTNGWGTSSVIPVNFTVNGTSITIPEQVTNFGPVLGSGTVDPGNEINFVMDIPNSGIAASSRVHIKQ